LGEQLGLKPSAAGAVITRINEEGLAAGAELFRGMLITKVDNEPVKSAAALREALEKKSVDQGVLLQVYSTTGGTTYVLLKKG
jgi:S1-C subfamily serine protease